MRSNKRLRLSRLTLLASFVVFPLGFAQAAQGGACAVTQSSGRAISKTFPPSDRWYGGEKLAVMLPPNGVWRGLGPDHAFRDKLFWWSVGVKPGSESNLTVTGVKLDGDAAPAFISEATNVRANLLGGSAMLVMVEFPSAGCWQITGEYLGEKLAFVVEARADAPSTK